MLAITVTLSLIFQLIFVSSAVSDQKLVSVYTKNPPISDGNSKDTVWTETSPVVTKDGAANTAISISSVHSDERIFFLVTFEDSNESRLHRPWVWNDSSKFYEVGNLREDCFIFKWFMDPIPENLHIDSGEPHIADTWFWKANRTDPAGYADDKLQQLSLNKLNKANIVMSQAGKVTYLKRKGDFGKPAYRDKLFVDFKGQQLERFIPRLLQEAGLT